MLWSSSTNHTNTHTHTHTHTSGHTHNISAGSQGTKRASCNPSDCSRRHCAHNRRSTPPWRQTGQAAASKSDKPTRAQRKNVPKQPTRARRCNFTFTYFRASSGLSGDAREQRAFSKVRVFVQPLGSERFFASAHEDKTIAEKLK